MEPELFIVFLIAFIVITIIIILVRNIIKLHRARRILKQLRNPYERLGNPYERGRKRQLLASEDGQPSSGCFKKIMNLLWMIFIIWAVIQGTIYYFENKSPKNEYHYYYYDDTEYHEADDESASGSTVSFKGSYNSKYKGKPCKHKDQGDAITCGERGECYGGFDSQNWDASKCINCGHSYKDHE